MLRKSSLRRATPLKRKTRLKIRRRKAVQDAAFAREIKDRDGWACRLVNLHRGECRGRLQCCHIFGKQAYPHLRYVLDNAITGCAKGHLYGTYRPYEWYEFIRTFLPDGLFEALRRQAMGIKSSAVVEGERPAKRVPADRNSVRTAELSKER